MEKTKVLFLCTHNSVRSQIAEGLLRYLYGKKYEAFSAGTNPTQVHPLAIKVMSEIGIDISGQSSKGIEKFKDTDVDLAVSVCKNSAKTMCTLCSSPIIKSRSMLINNQLPKTKHYIVHSFNDPSEVEGNEEQKLTAFRQTRDEIRKWIITYFANLKTQGQ
jgi:arsenate reductase (thioredoxin)